MARQKLTEAMKIDTSDLPDLTPQQMKFVEGLAAGKSASDAFRGAYDVAHYQANSVWAEASKLKSNPKVRLWVTALRNAGFGQVLCTKEEHLRELADLRDEARAKGNVTGAIQAEKYRGDASGHYTQKIDMAVTDNDAVAQLAKLAESNPDIADMAKAIAAKHGLDLAQDEASGTRH